MSLTATKPLLTALKEGRELTAHTSESPAGKGQGGGVSAAGSTSPTARRWGEEKTPKTRSGLLSRPGLLLLAALSAAALIAVAVTVGRDQSRAGSGGWRAVDREVRQRYPDVPSVSTEALAAWLADSSRTPPLLLDTRTPSEYAVSHLAGARRVDPDADGVALAAALAGISRHRPVVVYCSVGWRSAGVAERLHAAGFDDVRNLSGSIFRWANEGRPVVRAGEVVREVHPYNALWGKLLNADLRASPDAVR